MLSHCGPGQLRDRRPRVALDVAHLLAAVARDDAHDAVDEGEADRDDVDAAATGPIVERVARWYSETKRRPSSVRAGMLMVPSWVPPAERDPHAESRATLGRVVAHRGNCDRVCRRFVRASARPRWRRTHEGHLDIRLARDDRVRDSDDRRRCRPRRPDPMLGLRRRVRAATADRALGGQAPASESPRRLRAVLLSARTCP